MVVGFFLLAYAFGLDMPTEDGQAFKNCFMLAFSVGLLVSNSLFSVKSAALWWFVCGALWQLKGVPWRTPTGLAQEAHAMGPPWRHRRKSRDEGRPCGASVPHPPSAG